MIEGAHESIPLEHDRFPSQPMRVIRNKKENTLPRKKARCLPEWKKEAAYRAVSS